MAQDKKLKQGKRGLWSDPDVRILIIVALLFLIGGPLLYWMYVVLG